MDFVTNLSSLTEYTNDQRADDSHALHTIFSIILSILSVVC